MENPFFAEPRKIGWRIVDERTGDEPFGDNVVALNKRSAVTIIRDRLLPRPVAPAPRMERF